MKKTYGSKYYFSVYLHVHTNCLNLNHGMSSHHANLSRSNQDWQHSHLTLTIRNYPKSDIKFRRFLRNFWWFLSSPSIFGLTAIEFFCRLRWAISLPFLTKAAFLLYYSETLVTVSHSAARTAEGRNKLRIVRRWDLHLELQTYFNTNFRTRKIRLNLLIRTQNWATFPWDHY